MRNIDVLEKLGIVINDYFEYLSSSGEGYYLLVDEFLFDSFVEKLEQMYGINRRQVIIAYNEIKCNCYDNAFVALAIAAYQVMIFYMLDSNTDSDAYNKKLFSSEAYRGINYYEYWYDGIPYAPKDGTAPQEKIWSLIKEKFKIKNIPFNTPFGNRNRYVQFPRSQNLLRESMHSFRIRYADIFINQARLEPNSGITYNLFEKLVFAGEDNNYNSLIKRMIFSFYCMWDGRSYKEIYDKNKKTTFQKEQQAKDEFIIKLQPEIQIYINRKLVNCDAKVIKDKYLWMFSENKYLTRKGSVFIQDIDYKDWLPQYRKTIDEDDEVLLLTEQMYFPKYIEHFRDEGKLEIFCIGQYKLLLLNSFSREDFDMIGIPVAPKPYYSLVGGVKIKRNTYYDFAPPAIKLNDTLKDKDKYSSIYIDSKEYPIVDGIAIISDELKTGKHCIKLLNSWDASEVYFNIESVSKAEISDNHGWYVNYSEKLVLPYTGAVEKIIDGLKSIKELKWISRKNLMTKNNIFRLFLQKNEELVNRFEKTRNIKLIRRGQYGN